MDMPENTHLITQITYYKAHDKKYHEKISLFHPSSGNMYMFVPVQNRGMVRS